MTFVDPDFWRATHEDDPKPRVDSYGWATESARGDFRWSLQSRERWFLWREVAPSTYRVSLADA